MEVLPNGPGALEHSKKENTGKYRVWKIKSCPATRGRICFAKLRKQGIVGRACRINRALPLHASPKQAYILCNYSVRLVLLHRFGSYPVPKFLRQLFSTSSSRTNLQGRPVGRNAAIRELATRKTQAQAPETSKP